MIGNPQTHFEPNLGQASVGARYVSRNAQCTLELRDAGLTLIPSRRPGAGAAASGPELSLQLKDRARNTRLVPERWLPAQAAYYASGDTSKWRTRIPTFGALRYQSAWCGIDWLIQGNGRHIEHEFILAPHAQLSQIRLRITGADRVSLEADGSLVIKTGAHEFRQHAPVGSQVSDNGRQPVGARFVLDSQQREISFAIDSYPTHQLVIDPVLEFSTSFAMIDAADQSTQAERRAA